MDEYSDAPMRRLPWDLREQAAMSANTGADEGEVGSFVWPEDPDERTLVPFYLSQREYTAIASAVDVGSDIAFSTDAIRVWWLFVQNMRYPVPICDLVTTALLTCEDVQAAIATLIATNPVVQDALRTFVTEDPAINEHITNIAAAEVLALENRLENLLKPEACDPGFVFNQTSVLVQLLHDLTEDVFEAIEVGTNQLERGDILVSAVPGIGGLLPFDEILALGDQIVEEVAEDYIGAYDEALYDDIRCGLFCLVKDDCSLSIDRAINFYIERLGEEVPDDPVEAFRAVLQFLIAGDFATDAPVYLMHLFCLTAIRLSQNILGIDFGKLGLRVTAAGDDSDDDWEILCTECVEPDTWIKDIFTGGDMHDWEIVGTFAAFSNGFTDGPADDIQIGIKKLFSGQTNTDMRVYFDVGFVGAITAQSLGNYDATSFVQMTKTTDEMWEAIGMSRNAGIFLNFVNSGGITGHKIIEIWYKLA